MTSPAEMLKRAWVEQFFAPLVAARKESVALQFETLLDAVIRVSIEATEWDGDCRRAAEILEKRLDEQRDKP
jgi:hypothetical protein